jgi:hypothetical protein
VSNFVSDKQYGDGPSCSKCGAVMVLIGVCEKNALTHVGEHFKGVTRSQPCDSCINWTPRSFKCLSCGSTTGPPQPDLEERQKFEAWLVSIGYVPPFERFEYGRYCANAIHFSWEGWMAARRLSPDRKLVEKKLGAGIKLVEMYTHLLPLGPTRRGIEKWMAEAEAELKTQEPAPKEKK